MRTVSLVVEHKEFRIGLDEKNAQEIEDLIFSKLSRNSSNSIKDVMALLLNQSIKNIELNNKITTILNKMSV
jgi:hypothetical protein